MLDNVTLTAKHIFSVIAAELVQVESEFERQARSNVQVIAYLADYLRESGGKRVRPALTILANYAVGGDGSAYNSIRMATVMEFLHTATLVHDDIIDSADTRRNRPTVNALYGNETAVLMGIGYTCQRSKLVRRTVAADSGYLRRHAKNDRG